MIALFFVLVGAASAATSPNLDKFRQVLKDVGTTSPALRSQTEKLLAEESRALEGRLTWTPKIAASAGKNIPGSELEKQYAQVEASVNLFRFGADVSSVKIANRQIEQARLQQDLARLQAESQAATLLFKWIELQRRVESQKDLARQKARLVDVAQDRYRRGQMPEQELEKARLDQKNSDVQIAQAEIDLINVRGQLEALLPGSSTLQDWPWLHLLNAPPADRAKKLELRKEFKTLSLQSEISESSRWQATTGWLPSLDLSSVWATAEVEPLGRGSSLTMLTLTIPLWDQGKTIGERGYWLHQRIAAEQDLERFRRGEGQRLATLNERRERLRKIAIDASDSNRKARALGQQSLQRFQAGRSTVNDLLLDQQRAVEADGLAQETMRQYHEALLEACLAADEEPSGCY